MYNNPLTTTIITSIIIPNITNIVEGRSSKSIDLSFIQR
nr:MAG TPA: hypothetical protein [Caudoviricetes sp.]